MSPMPDDKLVLTQEEQEQILAARKENLKYRETMIRARTAAGDEVEGPLGELWPWVKRTFGLDQADDIPDEADDKADEDEKPKSVMKFGRRVG